MEKIVKMKQIAIAQWTKDGVLSYSTFGLSSNGNVYRYDMGCEGWLPNSMEIATCIEEHRDRRKTRKAVEKDKVKITPVDSDSGSSKGRLKFAV